MYKILVKVFKAIIDVIYVSQQQ